jgi:carbonic anhydrase
MEFMDKFMRRIIETKEPHLLTPEDQDEGIDLQRLMGRVNLDKRWVYRGSFTTPPAIEGVLWNVLDDVHFIKPETLELYLESRHDHPKGDSRCKDCGGNNRELYPLNNRQVFYLNANQGGKDANRNQCRE